MVKCGRIWKDERHEEIREDMARHGKILQDKDVELCGKIHSGLLRGMERYGEIWKEMDRFRNSTHYISFAATHFRQLGDHQRSA